MPKSVQSFCQFSNFVASPKYSSNSLTMKLLRAFRYLWLPRSRLEFRANLSNSSASDGGVLPIKTLLGILDNYRCYRLRRYGLERLVD
jgi:hypothetical protein